MQPKIFIARGFTLIELLVVIAIIGILASIVSVSLISSRAKGRDAKRISDVRSIQLALETYYNDNGWYPQSLTSATNGVALSPLYIGNIPTDPTDNSTLYKFTTWNSTNSTNCVAAPNLPVGYHLGAGLEDTTNTALKQDRDLAVRSSATNCGSTADFDGTAATSNKSCGASASLTEGCYDVTN